MARPRSIYACSHCGAQHPRWLGRCTECGQWNTVAEEAAAAPAVEGLAAPAGVGAKPRSLDEIEAAARPRFATGIEELDRVLGGGLVPGAVVLLGGEPGVGKSTLALQLAARRERAGGPVLYVSGEESPEQVRLRADRLPETPGGIRILAETRVEALVDPWRELQPALVIVDSVQTLQTARLESAPGSVSQVRECAAALAAIAKTHHTALVLVGHVTKEGTLAGPRVLEHLVDVVLAFEGERGHPFRLLRAHKNRFGSTQEIGVFQMAATGLEQVENPSELFLAERRGGAPGSCIVPLQEGTRPLLVEVQALVAPSPYGTPRRTTLGVEDARVALLLAVLDRRSDVDLLSRDVYVNATGGVRVGEPSSDLAVALAIASSRLDCALPADAAACGEVGLGGEIRRVPHLELRAKEAARLGFTRLLAPASQCDATPPPPGLALVPVADLGEALAWLRRAGVDTAS
ncbi:MAG: DNA repair protein RadA [Proteobacteria bacterium]|nr:DNA repair protein RadA [Pseudomonadota bacterium]